MAYIIRANNEERTVLALSNESNHYIVVESGNWYFHPEQINMEYLVKTDKTWTCPHRGIGYWYNLEAPGISIHNVAWSYPNASNGYTNIKGLIGFWGRDTAASIAEVINTSSENTAQA
ncbi:MAG: DUF427 domain-containing protein [Anaerolineae bacterium]|nr:DUF427 domain-containing protein [Anaerolineae bacterium]MDQ7035625.1 DUF427 domain-containing protein [Anaerolineae bacterium]